MIKLIDKTMLENCKVKTLYNPFIAKIISELQVNSDIYEMNLYQQTDKDFGTSCVLLDYCSNVTLFAFENASLNEISDFLNAISFGSVLSNVPLSLECNEKHGVVLKLYEKPTGNSRAVSITNEEIKDVFPLLNDSFEFVDDFSMWYCDFSHKVRRNSACAAVIKNFDHIVSCALCEYITSESAVITGVCTEQGERGRGYATECIKKVSMDVYDKCKGNVFTLCENKVKDFYFNIGFRTNGEWYEYLR